jgi:hypothetical protein
VGGEFSQFRNDRCICDYTLCVADGGVLSRANGVDFVGTPSSEHIPVWLQDYPLQNGNELPGFAGFALLRNSKVGDVLMLPFWFLILLVFAVGTASWLPWRFSMGSLLIATTLVAVVLGLAVAMR